MLLLATQAEPRILAFEHPNLGRLVQPRHFPRITDTAARGVPWATDNDCFQGLDVDAYCAMLDRLQLVDARAQLALGTGPGMVS